MHAKYELNQPSIKPDVLTRFNLKNGQGFFISYAFVWLARHFLIFAEPPSALAKE